MNTYILSFIGSKDLSHKDLKFKCLTNNIDEIIIKIQINFKLYLNLRFKFFVLLDIEECQRDNSNYLVNVVFGFQNRYNDKPQNFIVEKYRVNGNLFIRGNPSVIFALDNIVGNDLCSTCGNSSLHL